MKKLKLFLTLLFPLSQTMLKNTLCILQSRQSHRKLQGIVLLNLRFCSPFSTRHSRYNLLFLQKPQTEKVAALGRTVSFSRIWRLCSDFLRSLCTQ
uniref:Putative secreted protein n=1 Tax=Anopheles darlingi TaxID=43151 RepID=A0A2M4DHZ2_ANODA